MQHLLHLLCTLLSSILRLDDLYRGCQLLTESLEAVSERVVALAQAGVDFAKRLSTALQQFYDAYIWHQNPKRFWVRGVVSSNIVHHRNRCCRDLPSGLCLHRQLTGAGLAIFGPAG